MIFAADHSRSTMLIQMPDGEQHIIPGALIPLKVEYHSSEASTYLKK